MANTISNTVSTTTAIDSQRFGMSQTTTITLSGNNQIGGTITPKSGSITAISLGSLSDELGLCLYNDNTNYTASIIRVSGSGVVGGVVSPIGAVLIPGAMCYLYWSGSITSLAADVVGTYTPTAGAGTALTGAIQYQITQS